MTMHSHASYFSDDILERAKVQLAALIGFNTVSKHSNHPLIDYMATTLGNLGADITILPDEMGKKFNLIARFGPADVAGLVWSGHTDVVPADEPDWESDPFEMIERDGYVFGRGTCDMKGFAACAMAVAPELAAAKLTCPVYLCFSYDEEVGCLGAPAIARYLATLPVPPEFAIIGEPSMMQLITGQKGKIAMRAEVAGTSGHSSFAPDHVNAIEYAAEAIGRIAIRARRYLSEGPFDPDFTVPHPTMLTTMIDGGVATNITPDSAGFTFELRSISGMDPEADLEALLAEINAEICAPMAAKAEGTGIRFDRLFSYPAMGDARGSEGFARYAHLLPAWGGKVSFGSEGGVFEQLGGIPAVIVGPGSIDQAHKPNEFVDLEQLRQCCGFLGSLIELISEHVAAPY